MLECWNRNARLLACRTPSKLIRARGKLAGVRACLTYNRSQFFCQRHVPSWLFALYKHQFTVSYQAVKPTTSANRTVVSTYKSAIGRPPSSNAFPLFEVGSISFNILSRRMTEWEDTHFLLAIPPFRNAYLSWTILGKILATILCVLLAVASSFRWRLVTKKSYSPRSTRIITKMIATTRE